MLPADSVSALLAVYHQEQPEYLQQSLASLLQQTLRPQQIVVVKDGPLTAELEQVLAEYVRQQPTLFTIIALEQNRGLTQALNAGLPHCTGTYIARMDSDDLAEPQRLEKQLAFLQSHPEVGVLSSSMYEFALAPEHITGSKRARVEHEAILRQMPYRNPINHPAVMFRKDLVVALGGYPELKYLEDYFLWVRLAEQGVRFHNLAEPLLRQRFSANTILRRGGWLNFRNECWLRWYMYRHGMTKWYQLVLAVLLQGVLRFSPVWLRRWLWQQTRKSVASHEIP